ncbi:Rz-like lysis system protein LysB [Pectobacterium wasabiae]|uniref:P2 LysB n=1 Tax=Pectobacterium wasabiae TaxID=55208 RepID=A0AAW3EMR7_9GAMM|nr:Rz-like lysis system protein LysB [Pectobacterium wasabiae]AOR65109.1 P2 LysB [Pectobacterium wasabiae CFBP 3304]EJS96538.1 Phage lysis regulatory protein, LysB family [Pectobacterium wasabiae CFBP 3304]KFX09628.1 P2 LysB [Pectobacterium wasabiae]KGA29830.1 P2 LysB [Pectobacterium wasabiae]
MRFDRIFLVVAALLVIVLMVTTGQLSEAEKTIDEQKDRLNKQSLELRVRDGVIDALQDTARRNEQAQAALRTKLSQAGQLAASRDNKIMRLLNENADLRRWYGTALPDDVKRLHRRPAFDTPDAYLRWLSEGNELPDTGQQPGNQR